MPSSTVSRGESQAVGLVCLVAALTIWLHGDATRVRPASAAGGDPGRGASLFARLPCGSCHAYIVPGANYRTADGKSAMPPIFAAMLSPSDIDDVVAFLLAHR